MPVGTVKSFDDSIGFGYIIPDDGGENLPVHVSAIRPDSFKTLAQGQRVSFDIKQGPKGKQAINVGAP